MSSEVEILIDRRTFAKLVLFGVPLTAAFAADHAKTETLRGKLIVGPSAGPAAETAEGRIAIDGDEPNRKVLHDERINGFAFEARGHFTAPGHFLIDPQHTRALLVRDQDGKLKMITYWCDICSIRTYIPGPCMCCQKYTDLDLRPPEDIR